MTASRERKGKISIVLMASGSGNRYGSNKLLDSFRGRPLFTYGLHRALESGADQICVVTRFHEIREYAEQFSSGGKVQVVWNAHPERGISESLRLGLDAETESDGCCFMVCDQPLLSADTLRRMFDTFHKYPDRICVCGWQGRPGNPALFPRELYGELRSLRGDQGGRQVMRRYPERILEIPVGRPEELWDVDYEADLAIMSKTL